MKTRMLAITLLSTCLLASQAQAIQIKPASGNSVFTLSGAISSLMGKLSSLDFTKLGASSYLASQGSKHSIPGGFTALPNRPYQSGSYPFQSGNNQTGNYGGGCQRNCPSQASVPEPSTIAMLGAGLLLVGYSQRRKSRKTSV